MNLRFFVNSKIDFMGVRNWAFAFSIILTIASIALVFTKGLNFGVDFTGGIVFEIRPEKEVEISDLRKIVADKVHELSLPEFTLQNVQNSNDYMIKVANKEGNETERKQIIDSIKQTLTDNLGNVEFRKVDYVGPQIGEELIKNAIIAVSLAFVGIFIFIWVRYEWQYSVFGIITLLHDTIIIIGFYSLSGLEFDSTSIAAILTLVGHSLNDSVVIYDRIRENFRKYKKMPISDVINISINQTLSRTILSSGTPIVSLLALLFFAGDALYGFSLAVIVGIVFATYSSIYISANGLVLTGLKRD